MERKKVERVNKPKQEKLKKVTYEEETIEIDNETGEVVKVRNTKTAIVSTEPDFLKLYLSDIKRIFSLEKNVSLVLYSIILRMGYDNKFVSVKDTKELIAKDTGLKVETIDVAISKLKKESILIPISKSVYLVDPNLFARGKWNKLKDLRLCINYNLDGTRTINSNMMQNIIEQGLRE
nr:MAG TPA: replication protein [Caudoviricetes sp.]